jgi:hypothetical protein
MLWYPPDLKYQVTGDLEVLGFGTHGQMWVESAVGKQLHLLEFNSNVSISVGDCRIDSLVVVQGKERDSYFYDTVLFNSTGKMDIEADNITLLTYEVQDRADDITLKFWNEEVNSYVSSQDPTTLTFRFESNTSDAIYVCMPEGSRQGLILDLVVMYGLEGVLKISGDQNFTLPLPIGERAGIMLTVSVPRNCEYVMQAIGNLQQVNLNNFSAVTYYLQDGLGTSNLGALFPRGKFAYGEKSMELTGSQDLNLTDFSGKVSLTHTSYLDLMRMLIDGTTSSFMIGSSGRQQLVSPRTASDVLFPSPFPFSWIGIAGIVTILIWYYKPSRKDVIVLSFVGVFLFGLLGWSIYHERPQWIQSTLAFATLVCSAIQILLLTRRARKSDSLKNLNPRKKKRTMPKKARILE